MGRTTRRLRQEGEGDLSALTPDSDVRELHGRVHDDLVALGLDDEEAAGIADRVVERLLERGLDAYAEIMAGVEMAATDRCAAQAELVQAQTDLQKIERLMGGFATELSKLDEILEVLATYVRRMRMDAGEIDDPTVH